LINKEKKKIEPKIDSITKQIQEEKDDEGQNHSTPILLKPNIFDPIKIPSDFLNLFSDQSGFSKYRTRRISNVVPDFILQKISFIIDELTIILLYDNICTETFCRLENIDCEIFPEIYMKEMFVLRFEKVNNNFYSILFSCFVLFLNFNSKIITQKKNLILLIAFSDGS
jgi:hypothetical protein